MYLLASIALSEKKKEFLLARRTYSNSIGKERERQRESMCRGETIKIKFYIERWENEKFKSSTRESRKVLVYDSNEVKSEIAEILLNSQLYIVVVLSLSQRCQNTTPSVCITLASTSFDMCAHSLFLIFYSFINSPLFSLCDHSRFLSPIGDAIIKLYIFILQPKGKNWHVSRFFIFKIFLSFFFLQTLESRLFF